MLYASAFHILLDAVGGDRWDTTGNDLRACSGLSGMSGGTGGASGTGANFPAICMNRGTFFVGIMVAGAAMTGAEMTC